VPDALHERVGVAAAADVRADQLPTGQARLVELARACACQPAVLLLDEPASGLSETETHAFGVLLRELATEGMAVVLVEHDVPLVLQVCDRIHVLDAGRMLASGTAEEIRTDTRVHDAYLGGMA
jgi:branched-chain amino acid transport system ATP-binding protein